MTGVAIRFEIDGMAGGDARLADLVALGEDLTPLMDAFGVAMVGSTVDRFETETEPDGTPWMPSWRALHGNGGDKTLSLTGRLKSSFDSLADANSVEWGTNVEYAAPLHFGAVIEAKDGGSLAFTGADGALIFAKNVVLPARPFIGFTDADRALLGEIAATFFEQRGEAAP